MDQRVSEQNQFIGAAVTLPHLVEQVGPTNEKIRKILADDSILWNKQPYIHEKAMIKLFAGFMERKDHLQQSDIDNIVKLFEWVKDLDPKQFPVQERIENREPLFINENNKATLKAQVEYLSNPDFLSQPGSLRWLNGVLRTYAGQVIDTGITKFNFKNLEHTIVQKLKL